MFIDGNYQEHAQPLDVDVTRVSAQLKVAGFGMSLMPGIDRPQLWLDQTHAYAKHNETTGELEIIERTRALAERWCPLYMRRLIWLDLPESYGSRDLESIDITTRGKVALHGVGTETARIDTWNALHVENVHIGRTAFLKTVQGYLYIDELTAPEDVNPISQPSVDLIAVTGPIAIVDSKASWRIHGNLATEMNVFGPHHP